MSYEGERPIQVTNSVKILYALLGVGAIRFLFELGNLPAQMEQTYRETHVRVPMNFMYGVAVVVFVITMGLMWLIAAKIGQGRNWARILYLVLFLIGAPFSLGPLMQSLQTSPLSGILGIVQLGAQVVVAIFLFQKPSADWFDAIKKQSSQAG